MSQFEKKSGKKRERIAKGSQKVDVAKEGKQADNNSRKDKKDNKAAQEQGKGGRKRGRGNDRFKPAMTEEEQEDLDEAYELEPISRMPARVKCAELGWRTLDSILE